MKTNLTRRTLVTRGTAFATPAAKAGAQTAPWRPEKGAQQSLLRPKTCLQAEDDAFVSAMHIHQGH
jgi:hypothetical protein